jgi:hypothetical protein
MHDFAARNARATKTMPPAKPGKHQHPPAWPSRRPRARTQVSHIHGAGHHPLRLVDLQEL